MKIYIYQIWFPTSKKSYIGQSYNIKRRMDQHFKSGSLVCKALWKYDDWQVTILHTTSKELANQLEIEDIRNYNCIAPNGYNLTRGGEGGDTFTNNPNKEKIRKIHQEYRFTKKQIEKLKNALQGNKNSCGKNLDNKHAQGYHHTKEWKKENSKRMQGNKNLQGKKFSKEVNKKKGKSGKVNVMKNPINVLKCQRSRLKNKIKKYEQELENDVL